MLAPYHSLCGAQPSQGAHLLVQGIQEHNGLHSLPQSHLISQDRIGALGPGKSQPVEPFQLVRMQRASCGINVPRLLVKLNRRLKEKTQGSNQLLPASLQSIMLLFRSVTQNSPVRGADTIHTTALPSAQALLCATTAALSRMAPGSLLPSCWKSLQGLSQHRPSSPPARHICKGLGKEDPRALLQNCPLGSQPWLQKTDCYPPCTG